MQRQPHVLRFKKCISGFWWKLTIECNTQCWFCQITVRFHIFSFFVCLLDTFFPLTSRNAYTYIFLWKLIIKCSRVCSSLQEMHIRLLMKTDYWVQYTVLVFSNYSPNSYFVCLFEWTATCSLLQEMHIRLLMKTDYGVQPQC
jgi:hypothetical protein